MAAALVAVHHLALDGERVTEQLRDFFRTAVGDGATCFGGGVFHALERGHALDDGDREAGLLAASCRMA